MVADKDKIEQCVLEMAGANGSVAVQTITFIMQRWLHEVSHELTIREACTSLDVLAKIADYIAQDPETWTVDGRFSEHRYDYYYPGDQLGIHTDLRGVLSLLNRRFGTSFSIANAQNYLHDVEVYAGMLRQDLEGA